MTNNTITNAAMFTTLVNFVADNTDAFATYCANVDLNADDVMTKAAKHLETLTKKRPRVTTKSGAAIRNEGMAQKLAESLEPDQVVTLKDIQIMFGLQFPQGASAVVKVARDMGLIENAPKAKKSAPACYRLKL